MDWGGLLIDAGALAVRELALFAAAGFLLLGIGDLVIDFAWIGLRLKQLLFGAPGPTSVADLPRPTRAGPLVIFIPAWDESEVIGAMLRHALAVFDHPDYRIYVGCYPNDPATAAAVEGVVDSRIRMVVAPVPGPTTKADCLNHLWAALMVDEAAGAAPAKAIILHDAEDLVHSAELKLFDSLIERFDLVQIPVFPLVDPTSRWIGGSYIDEFCESHGKELVVREAFGAGIPSAGVGCAIGRDTLAALAEETRQPFDAASLTEDYELGLKLAAMGRRGTFVRLRGETGGLVCTREYFPNSFNEAVGQKSRWTAGIALSGWDRLGWRGGVAERWMRLRDRQALLAAVLLCAGYVASVGIALLLITEGTTGRDVHILTPTLALLMQIAGWVLLWRLAVRFAFVLPHYGVREGLRSIPRAAVSNVIAMFAARRALLRYAQLRRGASHWGKTRHAFPEIVPAE